MKTAEVRSTAFIQTERRIFNARNLQLSGNEGSLPKKVISLILEWAFDHKKELTENWNLAEEKQPLKKIEPLV